MSERVAIVVGAGGELGRTTAEKLAAVGFTTVGVDRSEEAMKELPDGIRREAADPTDPAAARSVVDRIAAEVGPPEVLVNTIGTYHLGEALAATPEDLRLMIEVNVGTALWLTQAVVPYLRERGSDMQSRRHLDDGASGSYRPMVLDANETSFTRPVKVSHAFGVNRRIGPVPFCLVSRTSMRLVSSATWTQLP